MYMLQEVADTVAIEQDTSGTISLVIGVIALLVLVYLAYAVVIPRIKKAMK